MIQLSIDQLQTLLKQNIPLVDIRRAEEWQLTGIIEQSHPLTFFDAKGRYEAESFLRQLETIASKNDPVMLICRSGVRTARLARFLEEKAGYTTVYNVEHGITAWIGQGLTTVAP